MYHYIIIFGVAAIIAFISTPIVMKLAYKLGAIDVPNDERRVHKTPIPSLGGLAIYISFIICSLLFLKLDKQVLGIIISGSIILVMGIFDDIRPLKAQQKLYVQILASIMLLFFGVTVKSITIPFIGGNGSFYIRYLGIPLTIIWVVGITNAINVIDGLDGLAGGICLISSLTLFGVSIISGRYTTMNLTAILSGACLGFLPFNFNPAKIFMGDTGALFLGFILAAISIQGATKSAAAVAVAVPILAIGLPIYDTLFAMIRRKLNKKPMMGADRGHLHHRLLDMGLSQRQAVLSMYSISTVLGSASIIAMRVSSKKSFAILVVVCSIVIAIALELGIFDKKVKNL
jgi:UDP-GlcNAc:undecaprenyl-phosphate/decaprenyl-phosphate GlcNAc-1-phosphate transferase